ncbi:recombinase family protein [Paenibacillus sp. Soil787]|uniref:recombinase family protein n=1 Tax=Paenibacillus sp. Soil787 TaxID=1736411 RepID=UPI00070243B8|nr:recombinase family protein [Paenibacillus sp. Soil787]KRF18647.1 hypothetical protein ASG93_11460 [Paenibacillus sp. Soil787]
MSLTVAYYRSSSELQEDSVGTQQFYAMQYCSNNMLLIDDEFTDEFVSAKLVPLKKRNFHKVIEGINKGDIKTLIIYKRDRLARDVVEYMEIYSVLRRHNVQVHFTASHEAPMRFDEMGEFYELIMAGLCQHEGDQIKLRISEARAATFQKGKHKGNLPYGYVINEETGKIMAPLEAKENIKLIFSELLSEKYNSTNELRWYLKRNNIQKLRLKETKKFNPEWNSKAIEDLISNPMYMGMRQMNFKGDPVNYSHKDYVIIDVENWLRAQDILQNMKSGKLRSKRPKGSFLLEEIITCGVCKSPLKTIMRQRMKNWVGVYECKEHKIKLLSDEADSEIFDICSSYFFTILTDYGENLFKVFFTKRTDVMKQEIKQLEQTIDRLTGRIVSSVKRLIGIKNVMERAGLENKLVALELKLKEVRENKEQIVFQTEKLKELPAQIKSFKDKTKFMEVLKNLELHERLVLLKDIIIIANVTEEGMELKLKHPYLSSYEVE